MAIATDLLKAENVGKRQLEKFIAERVESNNVSFYLPIQKNKLKSFAELRVQKKVKVNEKLVTEKASYHMFSKFLIIQRSRQIDMKDMVQYEVGPFPWALAKPNGKTRSSTKSALMNTCEKEVPLVHLLPDYGKNI